MERLNHAQPSAAVSSTLLDELRAATREAHAALDARFALHPDRGLTREQYAAFLRGSLAAVELVEPACMQISAMEPKSRARCLRDDLSELGSRVSLTHAEGIIRERLAATLA